MGLRKAALVGAIAVLGLLAAAGLARQQGILSPSALSCRLDPLTLPLFDATPAAMIAAPSSPIDQSEAAPAPDDTREEVEESLAVIIACGNTGEPRYAFAIFTGRYLADLFVGEKKAYQPAFERRLTQPPRPPEEPLVLREITDLRLLPDDRAIVTIKLDGGTQTFTDTMVLVRQGDQWLVDQVLELEPEPF